MVYFSSFKLFNILNYINLLNLVRYILEKLEENLHNSLIRMNFVFKNEEISTVCIKNYKSLSFLGKSFGPYEEGSKYRLKLFLAIPLIKNNVLKITENEKCDNFDVQRYAIDERDESKLILRKEKYFLNKIKEFKGFMVKDIENKLRPSIDLDRYNSYMSNIIDNRLLKLLKLAKAELSLDDERRITASEKLLFDNLFNYIKEWRDFFKI